MKYSAVSPARIDSKIPRSPTTTGVRMRSRPFSRQNNWLAFGFILWSLALTMNLAHAANVYWTNTSGGNWSTAANWSTGTMPGATDNTFITNNGTYTVTLDVSATVNNLTFGGLNGQQTFLIAGPTLALNGIGQISTNAILNCAGGTIAGTGTFNVGGKFIWTSGTLSGSGTVNVLQYANIYIGYGFVTLGGWTIDNQGTTIINGSGTLIMNNGAVLTNGAGATLEISSPAGNIVAGTYSGTNEAIYNNGLMQVSGPNRFNCYVPFFNAGTVQVQQGDFQVGGGTQTGSFTVTNGATLDFIGSPQTLTGSASVSGGGTVSFEASPCDINGTYNVTGTTLVDGGTADFNSGGSVLSLGSLTVAGGTANLNTGVLQGVSDLNVTSGTLAGGDTLNVTNGFAWSGGSLSGSGTVNVLGTFGMYIGYPNYSVSLSGWTINNLGTTTIAGSGTFIMNNGAVLTNGAGATLEISSLVGNIVAGTYTGTNEAIYNSGLMQVSGPNRFNCSVPFFNAGTVQVQSGTIQLSSSFSNTPSSILSFPIGGEAVGANYGQLAISGNFPLAGTLSVGLTNGFTPNVGDSFRILNWGTKQGGFTSANGFDLGNGLYFQGIADKSGLSLVTRTTVVPTPPPATNLVNQTVAYGDSAVFSFSPLGVAPFTYQWSFDGTSLIGQTNALLIITNVQTASLGDYCVFVTDALGATNTYCATLTALSVPGITTQPSPQTVSSNTTIILTAVGNGDGPLRYQWRINGENIPGATQSTYTITNAQPENGGMYSVLVANPVRVISSTNAEVIIQSPPLPFDADFPGGVLADGYSGVGGGNDDSVTSEAGDPELDGKIGAHLLWVQWTAPASGVATFGTEGSSFDTLLGIYTGTSLTNLVAVAADDDRGGYFTSQVAFNAEAGTNYLIAVDGRSTDSGDLVLNWNLNTNITEIPMIVEQPLDTTVVAGGAASFDMFAASTAALSYQWYLGDWLAIAGATNNTLTITNVSDVNVGTYSVAVTAATGESVESLPASLEIGPSLSYDKLEDLLDYVAGLGGPLLRFKPRDVTVGGFPSVSIGTIGSQLINNFNSTTEQGEPIHADVIGGSSRWYLLTAVTNATLEIDTLGSDVATVLAVYTGSNIFSLQTIATNVNGASDGVHSKVKFASANDRSYLVAVDGVNGAQGNINLNWRMGIPPNAAGPVKNLVTTNGANLVLLSGVTNNATTPAYQWQLDGVNIVGATNGIFALSGLGYNKVGSYGVVVSNLVGVVVSSIATVTAQTPLQLTPGGQGFQLSGSSTQAVVLQLSTNLTLWTPLYTNTSPLLPISYTDTNSAKRPETFYKINPWP